MTKKGKNTNTNAQGTRTKKGKHTNTNAQGTRTKKENTQTRQRPKNLKHIRSKLGLHDFLAFFNQFVGREANRDFW